MNSIEAILRKLLPGEQWTADELNEARAWLDGELAKLAPAPAPAEAPAAEAAPVEEPAAQETVSEDPNAPEAS